MINEINEEKLPVFTLEIPNGEHPDSYLEGYFGMLPIPSDEMPSDVDTDEALLIALR